MDHPASLARVRLYICNGWQRDRLCRLETSVIFFWALTTREKFWKNGQHECLMSERILNLKPKKPKPQ